MYLIKDFVKRQCYRCCAVLCQNDGFGFQNYVRREYIVFIHRKSKSKRKEKTKLLNSVGLNLITKNQIVLKGIHVTSKCMEHFFFLNHKPLNDENHFLQLLHKHILFLFYSTPNRLLGKYGIPFITLFILNQCISTKYYCFLNSGFARGSLPHSQSHCHSWCLPHHWCILGTYSSTHHQDVPHHSGKKHNVSSLKNKVIPCLLSSCANLCEF